MKPRIVKPWTAAEENMLMDLYPEGDRQALEKIFGRSWEAIKNMAAELKVKRVVRKTYSSYTVRLYRGENEVVRYKNIKADKDAKAKVNTLLKKWDSTYEQMLMNGIYYVSVQNNLEKFVDCLPFKKY